MLRGRKVLAVVISQMVVTDNGYRLEAGADQKVNQHGLEFRLARLEIVTTNEDVGLFGHFNTAGNECVLRRSVNKRALHTFKNILNVINFKFC